MTLHHLPDTRSYLSFLNRLSRPIRKSLLVRWGLAFLIITAMIGGIFGAAVANSYHKRALELDYSQVTNIREGATVLDSTGNQLGAISENRVVIVSRDEIPDHFLEALYAAEDSRFKFHPGYDLKGIMRAAIANLKKQEIDQGASTITQQLARNCFELTGRTYDRKLLEVFAAREIEKAYTKDEIVTHYLNRIYLGNGFWGLGAAAAGYFGKSPSELTVGESAMLCGMIRYPNPLSPFKNPQAAIAARNRILNRMADEGFLTANEAGQLSEKPLYILENDGRNNQPRFLLAKVEREAKSLLNGASLDGMTIETAVEPMLQKVSEEAVNHRLSRLESTELTGTPTNDSSASANPEDRLQGSAIVIENATGRVVAVVGSRDHQESEYDRASLTRRPAGTAFFPLLYAAAYDSGVSSPLSTVFDAPIDNREVMMGGQTGILGEWGVENLQPVYRGAIPSGFALIAGKNAASVRLGFETGLETVRQFAARAGIRSPLGDYPSTFIGASEVTLEELTHAYSAFANTGWKTADTGPIDRILDRNG
ncbi:MAG: hypothetical protein HKN23_03375, partial [Verrucomicrobiales bacterium]|nr:hypothetical protein [Verrucomicrobiales bacterium]